jgi:hypothetical protein
VTGITIANSPPLAVVIVGTGSEFIAAQFGEREGQAPRVHDLGQPTPTLCATGRVNLVMRDRHHDRELATLGRGHRRHGFGDVASCGAAARLRVVPVTQSGGGAAARDVSEPVPTMTTAKGGEFAIVTRGAWPSRSPNCAAMNASSPRCAVVIVGSGSAETVTSKGRFGMVVPVTQSGGGAAARDVSEPVPTMLATCVGVGSSIERGAPSACRESTKGSTMPKLPPPA